MKKLRKNLTGTQYRLLLETIGKNRPLRAYEIKEKMGFKDTKAGHYVHEMIKAILFPTRDNLMLLFQWSKIPGTDDQYNYKVVKKLNDIFRLKWTIGNADYEYVRNNIIFKKSKDNEIITISYDPLGKVRIKINPKQKDKATLEIFTSSNEKRRMSYLLTIKENKNDRYAYASIVSNFEPLIRYLSIESDRFGNRLYSLNIRGFILYILGEIELEKEKKGDEEKKTRIHNIRITEVLDNLCRFYGEEFPFLMYYHDFKREYRRLSEANRLPKNFEITLLKNIAKELQHILHKAHPSFLRYWVTKRYSEGILDYFTSLWGIGSPIIEHYNLEYLSHNKLKDYQLKCLKIITDYLKYEYEEMKSRYDYILNKNELLTHL